VQVERADALDDALLVFAIADEDIAEGKTCPSQEGQSLEDVRDSFFLHESGNGHEGIGWSRRAFNRMGEKEVEINAVVNAVYHMAMIRRDLQDILCCIWCR
jgi:hypothetical protein